MYENQIDFNNETKIVSIENDNKEKKFVSFNWLRLLCRCDICGDSRTGKKWQNAIDIPTQLSILELSQTDTSLAIIWSDHHHSHYNINELVAEAINNVQQANPKETPPLVASNIELWGSEITKTLPTYHADAMINETATLYKASADLMKYGIIRIQHVENTRDIPELFGPIHPNSYGEIQDLISKPDARVAGETSNAQLPHTDEPFRYNPPGYIFFHALKAGLGEDGTSIMVDGFHIAQQLQQTSPKSFKILSEHRVFFHRMHGNEIHYETEAPAICLTPTGQLSGIRYNDRCFGPQKHDMDLNNKIIEAFKHFTELLSKTENQLRYKLEANEMLIFDNHRILHGRTAFDPQKAIRHLRSCNVDRDEVHSKFRSLNKHYSKSIHSDIKLPQGLTY